MKNEFETRAFSFELRASRADDIGIIEGRPIVYNSRTDLGYFDEVIAAGALDKADLKDVRFLVNHDLSRIPLARSRNNNENSTMQLIHDNDGLGIRVKLDVERNTEAMNLYSAVERGDISGMSFMFVIDACEWLGLDTDHPTRKITAISQVIEVSAVTFPAYEDTEISVRDKTALESARKALDSARKSLDSEKRQKLELEKLKIKYLTP